MNRLRIEPGVAPDSIAAFTSVIANSHRFIHVAMSLEAGLSSSPIVPARPEFRTFTNDVDATLYLSAAALRGGAVPCKDLPDLRESYRSLAQSGKSGVERYDLVNTEADRITNSLNTLSELIRERLPDGS